MKIYCIETGKVKVKKNQVRRAKGPLPGVTNIIFGKEWSDWLPILAWVIDHPEGIFVVDTGETSRVLNKGYLPAWHPYWSSVQFDVQPEDEIGPRLKKIGIDPARDVDRVIMTHLHSDHAGGMRYFPNARFLIHQGEYKDASGFMGKVAGYLPHRLPDWLDPEFIEFENDPIGPFEKHQCITSDGKIKIVPTPGHVRHHISVIAEMDGINYFLAGDTSYNQEMMLMGLPDGVGTDQTVGTLEKIHTLAHQIPMVYLPAHDPESAKRHGEKRLAIPGVSVPV